MDYTLSRKITLNSLLTLFTLMNKLGIDFFLDSGTLLKFVRNNRKLTIGSDIDIGIFEKDKKKIFNLKVLLEKRGFKISLQNNFSVFYDYIRINFPKNFKGKSKHVDIYIYRNIKKFYILKRPHKFSKNSLISKLSVYGINFLNQKKYKKFIFINFLFHCLFFIYNNFGKSEQFRFPEDLLKSQLQIIYFINNQKVIFNIPKNYSRYLSYRYTSNWRFPDKNWKKRTKKFLVNDNLKIDNYTFQH